MVKLTVDNREQAIIDELTAMSADFDVQQLDIGDFQFTNDNTICLLLERKTYVDLAASISDGRYRNQKLRLLAAESQHRGYLIEGQYPRSSKVGRIPRSTLDSSLLSSQLRDGFVVINSIDHHHTAQLLVKLQSKLPYTDSDAVSYLSTVKTIKKENLTPGACYRAQLMQIPGVSDSVAELLATRYPTMADLLLVTNNDEGATIIANINGKSRKLGQVLGKRICDYLSPPPPAKKKITISKKQC